MRAGADVQSLAESHPDPILRFDPAGCVVYANPAAEQLARACGRPAPAELVPKEAEAFLGNAENPARDRLRLEIPLGNRTHSWLFFRDVRAGGVHCQVQDITERQQLEAQWLHAQKLESIGRLAAGIAHDFGNLLTVIQGHAGLLRSDPDATATIKESVQQIGRAAERGGRLTSQLLAFSRRNVLQPRALDLNEVVTQLSSLLHRTLGEDISYQFSYAPELPRIHADPGLMEQVVMNLAANARQAMPQGGQMVIGTSRVEVDEAQLARHSSEARLGIFVCLTISDTGCGMDAATLGRIFEPFFSTNESGPGRGLGLAAVYGIVKQHLGWIEVRSQPGQGSTFRVFLPEDTRSAGAAAPAPAERSTAGTETILVVEDEQPVRWIVKEVLGKSGYEVIEAGNGVEALAQWHQNHRRIALLLTDMIMPVGLSGQELAEKFTAQKPDLKVMYISGYSLQVAGRGLSVGDGPHFLQKPFDGPRLAQAVRHCLDA